MAAQAYLRGSFEGQAHPVAAIPPPAPSLSPAAAPLSTLAGRQVGASAELGPGLTHLRMVGKQGAGEAAGHGWVGAVWGSLAASWLQLEAYHLFFWLHCQNAATLFCLALAEWAAWLQWHVLHPLVQAKVPWHRLKCHG